MADRAEPRRHSVVGWLLLVGGVMVPGAMAVVAVVNPALGWLQYPPTIGAPLVQTLVLLLGIALLAATVGVALHRRWGWWLAVAWGFWSVIEVVRPAVANPFEVTLSLPQIIAVLFLGYVWNRRGDFGVSPGARSRGRGEEAPVDESG